MLRPSLGTRDAKMIRFSMLFLLFISPSSILAAPCSLCPDGSSTPVPSKLVTIPGYPEADCQSVETAVPFLITDDTSDSCKLTHQMSSLCGCPRSADSCSLCPDGLPAENIKTSLPAFKGILGDSGITCELLEAYLHPYPETDTFCSYSQRSAAETCGCRQVSFLDDEEGGDNHTRNDNIFDHHGGAIFNVDPTSNVWVEKIYGGGSLARVKRLPRLFRASAIIAGISALLVIFDNLRNRRKRLKNVYNQIVTVMACFDVVYSIAAAIGNHAKPSYTNYKGSAIDTYATCKAQGWAFQWSGMISLFLNAALSTYFVLVVVYGCREFRLKQLRKWLISIPIVIGSILGFGAIPFIVPYFNGCSVNPPMASTFSSSNRMEKWGYSTSWAPFLGFIIVPGFAVLVYTTVSLLWVFLYVRKINKRTARWRHQTNQQMSTIDFTEDPVGNALNDSSGLTSKRGKRRSRTSFVVRQKKSVLDKLQREVFVQSGMYLFALYLSWFVYLYSAIEGEKYLLSHYGFWVLIHIVTPLQGFFNCIVYFRPRLSMRWSVFWTHLIKRRQRLFSSDTKEEEDINSGNQKSSSMYPEPAADLVQLNENDSSTEEYEDGEEATRNAQEDQQHTSMSERISVNFSTREFGATDSPAVDVLLPGSSSMDTCEASGSMRVDIEESPVNVTYTGRGLFG